MSVPETVRVNLIIDKFPWGLFEQQSKRQEFCYNRRACVDDPFNVVFQVPCKKGKNVFKIEVPKRIAINNFKCFEESFFRPFCFIGGIKQINFLFNKKYKNNFQFILKIAVAFEFNLFRKFLENFICFRCNHGRLNNSTTTQSCCYFMGVGLLIFMISNLNIFGFYL